MFTPPNYNYTLETLAPPEIDRGDRVRGPSERDKAPDFGTLASLKESIEKYGIIQPLAVMKKATPGENEFPFLLLAGGRRLFVASRLGIDVPAKVYLESELTPLDRKSIELDENLKRENFTPAEEVKLTAEIVALQRQKAREAGEAEPTLEDLSEIVGKSIPELDRQLILAKAIEVRPELAKITTKKQGYDIVRKAKEQIVLRELTRRQEAKIKDSRLDTYAIADFFEVAPSLEGFGFADIDPPYGISLSKGDQQSWQTFKDVTSDDYETFITATLASTFECLSKDAWVIVWFDMSTFSMTLAAIKKAGFECCGKPGIWYKQGSSFGLNHTPNKTLSAQYEPFFYASKGNPTLTKVGTSEVLPYKRPDISERRHPTQKNFELMRELLTRFTIPSTKVLVPFAGSGETLRAATSLNLESLGTDLSEEFHNSYMVAATTPQEIKI